ncbi:MAG: transcriptional repressor, partial [Oscillospiraceae bacterium]|nr:transcriptional repressor [Oscillospiraceae bacterium]
MEQRLRESGLKATRQRVAILRCLEQAGGEALTAEELFEQLNPTTGVDRSTVYRCLEALENHHLGERMEHRGGACYCIAGKDHRHLLM